MPTYNLMRDKHVFKRKLNYNVADEITNKKHLENFIKTI